MKFIRIKTLFQEIIYQSNQLLSIERITGKSWKLTFTDGKEYIIMGIEYLSDFPFIRYPDMNFYELEASR